MSNLIDKKIKELVEKKGGNSSENLLIKKINTILMRKDIINLNNDKVDTLRLLTHLIEGNGKPSRLVGFLKA